MSSNNKSNVKSKPVIERSAVETLSPVSSLVTVIATQSMISKMKEKGSLSPSSTPSSIDISTWPILDESRYQVIQNIGRGGMGVVHHVYDRLLHRNLALKVLQKKHHQEESVLQRFIDEARLCTWLQHPSIVAVHEFGVWHGQPAFLMNLVQGEVLSIYIQQLHQSKTYEEWHHGAWSFRRLLESLYQVSMVISFAHQQGVIHRDLKPDNIMLGQHGEILVLDWGIAKFWKDSSKHRHSHLSDPDHQGEIDNYQPITIHELLQTQEGTLTGTLMYMSPEQAKGQIQYLGPWSDVYSLGCILYEILSGSSPHRHILGDTPMNHLSQALEQIVTQDPLPLSKASVSSHDPCINNKIDTEQAFCYAITHNFPIEESLIQLCSDAMNRSIDLRLESATLFAQRLRDILDGSQRREQALKFVQQARDNQALAIQASYDAHQLETQAQTILEVIPKWESADAKKDGWALEDQAKQYQRQAQYLYATQFRLLQKALAQDHTLVEAHQDLSFLYLDRHHTAELHKQFAEANNHEIDLRHHISYLNENDPIRQKIERYLYDHSTVSLQVDQDASIEILRYKLVERRLVATPMELILVTPVLYELPLGSYVARIECENFHHAIYPFVIKRGKSWSSYRSLQESSFAIPLIPKGQLDSLSSYIPAGYFESGGDPLTPNSVPNRSVWLDGFVINQYPITHEQYLIFLNDLINTYGVEVALRWVPRQQASDSELGDVFYQLYDNVFVHPYGDQFLQNPVVLITWYAACAYASWKQEQDGKPWRLPLELEWEKAMRGVDGRSFPWGNHFDPSWCSMMDSHSDGSSSKIHPVGAFEADQSVYQIRDGAGNIREWCLDLFEPEGAKVKDQVAVFPSKEDYQSFENRSSKGGSAGNNATRTRCADRDWWSPYRSYIARGFRLAYSYPMKISPSLEGLLHYLDEVPDHAQHTSKR